MEKFQILHRSHDEEEQQSKGLTEDKQISRSTHINGNKIAPIRTSNRKRRRPKHFGSPEPKQDHPSDISDNESYSFSKKRKSLTTLIHSPLLDNNNNINGNKEDNTTAEIKKVESDDDSEAEYSDYYEEMMKGDETMAHIEITRRRSSVFRRPSTVNLGSTTTSSSSTTTNTNTNTVTDSPKLVGRKPSISLNGFLGENEFWTPYTFEQDLVNDTMFLSDHTSAASTSSSAHQQIPLNIVSPESISESELELYFGGPTQNNNNHGNNGNGSTENASSLGLPAGFSARTSRKSFCTLANGKEASLLQRALLASTARDMALDSPVFDNANNMNIFHHHHEEDEEEQLLEPSVTEKRRRSWPLVGKALSEIELDPDLIINNIKLKETAITSIPSEDTSTTFPKEQFISSSSSSTTELNNAIDLDNNKHDHHNDNKMKTEIKKDGNGNEVKVKESTDDEEEGDDSKPSSKTYSENGHQFTITKKLLGNLLCYELNSPDDIPDTKILRFIASNDGASEHVALRTRHADSKQHQRRNNQYYYLVEGCVNATQLRKAARPVLGKGSFDAAAEAEDDRLVITLTKGPIECRGAWVPLSRARELVDEFEIESSPGLAKLLGDDPMGGELELNTKSVLTETDYNNNSSNNNNNNNNVNNNHNNNNNSDNNNNNNNNNSTNNTETSPKPSVVHAPTPSKIESISTNASADESNDDEFVRFEEDEKPTTNSSTSESISNTPSNPIPSETDTQQQILNKQNINLQALQQLQAALPGLSNLSPTFDFAKSLASYMQTIAKVTSSAQSTSSASAPSPSTVPLNIDLKAALARIPALDALFKKDLLSSLPITTPSSSSTSSTSSSTSALQSQSQQQLQPQQLQQQQTPSQQQEADTNKIFPNVPTNPPMYVTVIENVTVCVATLSVSEETGSKSYKILRRLDTGYVNGQSLLTAGGIDTERERNMILSFEIERVRIPNKENGLYGTWIPLRRAQELAVTCSIQNKLGPFLSDHIETLFPSSLPIARGPTAMRGGKPIMRLRRTSSSSNVSDIGNKRSPLHMISSSVNNNQRKPTPSTHIQQLLLSHPYKTLKLGNGHPSLGMLKAPLLGSFDRTIDYELQRSVTVINSSRPYHHKNDDHHDITATSSSTSSSSSSSSSSVSSFSNEDTNQDFLIDIINDNDTAVVDEDGSDADTESDTDINEVRKRMKRMRDAAIDAMETGQSMEELLSRASSPIVQPVRSIQFRMPSSSSHLHHHQQQSSSTSSLSNTNGMMALKRRRLFDIDEEGNVPPAFRKPANFLPHGRRRPPTTNGTSANGKWSSGKLTASMIKKSASWNGSLPLPRNTLVIPGTKKPIHMSPPSHHHQHNNNNKRKKIQRNINKTANENIDNHVVEHHENDKSILKINTTIPSKSNPISSIITNNNNNNNNNMTTGNNITETTTPTVTVTATTNNNNNNNNNNNDTNNKEKNISSLADTTTVKVTKSSISDEEDEEDEEIDIGGSDDDDDVR
ncbi:unnamed protein product [Cunninghamella echinulata]